MKRNLTKNENSLAVDSEQVTSSDVIRAMAIAHYWQNYSQYERRGSVWYVKRLLERLWKIDAPLTAYTVELSKYTHLGFSSRCGDNKVNLFQLSVMLGLTELVEFFIEKHPEKIDVNEEFKWRGLKGKEKIPANPLYAAVRTGAEKKLLEALIKAGADVSQICRNGRKKKRFALPFLEVDERGSKFKPLKKQYKQFMRLIKKGKAESIVNFLEEWNPTWLKVVDEKTKLTPIHVLAQRKDTAALKALIADDKTQAITTELLTKKDQSKFKRTVLHHAVVKGNIEVVQFLIGQGANVNAKDANGNTAYHLAAQRGNKKGNREILIFLENEGADATITNKAGKTAAQMSSSRWFKNKNPLFLANKAKLAISEKVNEIISDYIYLEKFDKDKILTNYNKTAKEFIETLVDDKSELRLSDLTKLSEKANTVLSGYNEAKKQVVKEAVSSAIREFNNTCDRKYVRHGLHPFLLELKGKKFINQQTYLSLFGNYRKMLKALERFNSTLGKEVPTAPVKASELATDKLTRTDVMGISVAVGDFKKNFNQLKTRSQQQIETILSEQKKRFESLQNKIKTFNNLKDKLPKKRWSGWSVKFSARTFNNKLEKLAALKETKANELPLSETTVKLLDSYKKLLQALENDKRGLDAVIKKIEAFNKKQQQKKAKKAKPRQKVEKKVEAEVKIVKKDGKQKNNQQENNQRQKENGVNSVVPSKETKENSENSQMNGQQPSQKNVGSVDNQSQGQNQSNIDSPNQTKGFFDGPVINPFEIQKNESKKRAEKQLELENEDKQNLSHKESKIKNIGNAQPLLQTESKKPVNNKVNINSEQSSRQTKSQVVIVPKKGSRHVAVNKRQNLPDSSTTAKSTHPNSKNIGIIKSNKNAEIIKKLKNYRNQLNKKLKDLHRQTNDDLNLSYLTDEQKRFLNKAHLHFDGQRKNILDDFTFSNVFKSHGSWQQAEANIKQVARGIQSVEKTIKTKTKNNAKARQNKNLQQDNLPQAQNSINATMNKDQNTSQEQRTVVKNNHNNIATSKVAKQDQNKKQINSNPNAKTGIVNKDKKSQQDKSPKIVTQSKIGKVNVENKKSQYSNVEQHNHSQQKAKLTNKNRNNNINLLREKFEEKNSTKKIDSAVHKISDAASAQKQSSHKKPVSSRIKEFQKKLSIFAENNNTAPNVNPKKITSQNNNVSGIAKQLDSKKKNLATEKAKQTQQQKALETIQPQSQKQSTSSEAKKSTSVNHKAVNVNNMIKGINTILKKLRDFNPAVKLSIATNKKAWSVEFEIQNKKTIKPYYDIINQFRDKVTNSENPKETKKIVLDNIFVSNKLNEMTDKQLEEIKKSGELAKQAAKKLLELVKPQALFMKTLSLRVFNREKVSVKKYSKNIPNGKKVQEIANTVSKLKR